MLETLKSLALPWTSDDGQLTVSLLSFTSLWANKVYGQFAEIVPREQWKRIEVSFANFNTFVMDVQVGDKASPVEKVFGVLWAHRTDDLAARWELFQMLYSAEFYRAFDTAYEATRDRTFEAPIELQTAPPDNADPEQPPASPPPAAD